MAAPRGPINLAGVLTFVQIVSTLGNINWKGLAKMATPIRDYWGRIALVGIAAALVLFVCYDWRRAHVEKLEAEAAVVAVTAERDTLIRARDAELIARAQRAEDLANLSTEQVQALAEVKDIMAKNKDWASQPLPEELRRRLAQ